jgi:hypothetical protein
LIPVAEFAVVAQLQVNFVTEQLSAVTGFVVATLAARPSTSPTFELSLLGKRCKVD